MEMGFLDQAGSDAVQEYIMSKNAEIMDEGDVQIYVPNDAEVAQQEDGTVKVLGYYLETTYTADGADLKLCAGAGTPVLMTLLPKDDGTYEVTEAARAEDGSGYTESINKMCEEIGISPEEFEESMAMNALLDITVTTAYMKAHPEVERLEYNGEMLTAEELLARSEEIMNEWLATLESAVETEAE